MNSTVQRSVQKQVRARGRSRPTTIAACSSRDGNLPPQPVIATGTKPGGTSPAPRSALWSENPQRQPVPIPGNAERSMQDARRAVTGRDSDKPVTALRICTRKFCRQRKALGAMRSPRHWATKRSPRAGSPLRGAEARTRQHFAKRDRLCQDMESGPRP